MVILRANLVTLMVLALLAVAEAAVLALDIQVPVLVAGVSWA
jgi:hypothetical protein